MTTHASTIGQLWAEVIGVQPDPPAAVVAGAAVLALLAVLVRGPWRVLRTVITVAHEGGHAVVAVLAGRRLRGVRLHSDTSGVTLSHGRPTGPGMVATTLAGYLAPSLVGLGFAGLLTAGHITAMLWLSIALLLAMLTLIRNAYGVLAIVVTVLVVFAVSWFAPSAAQAAFGYLFTLFLIIGGVRPVWELQQLRRRGRAPDSDADQLARLTGVPGLVWVGLFGVVAVLIVGLTGSWLVPAGTWDAVSGLPRAVLP